MKQCWKVLGIEPTNNTREIKQAYAQLVKQYHPEDQSEAFIKLSNAYEQALLYAKGHQATVKILGTQEERQSYNEEETSLQRRKPVQITIGNIDAVNENENIPEDKMQEYLIKRVKKILKSSVSKQTVSNIFYDKKILSLFNDEEFKRKIIKTVVSYSKKMDKQTLLFLKKMTELHECTEYDNRIDRYVEKKKFYEALPALLCLGVFLLFLLVYQIAKEEPTLSPQQEKAQQVAYEERRNESMSMSLNLELSEYQSYLNGVSVTYDNGYHVVDEEGTSLLSITISNVSFTKSGLILLHCGNGDYYLYDTLNRNLNSEAYAVGKTVLVEEDGVLHESEKVLIKNRSEQWYLLDERGNLWITADTEISNELSTWVEKVIINEGKIVSIEKESI